jgi:hypothetical protein
MPTADKQIAPQEAALAPVLEKFPETAAAIRELFHRSASFQSLCGDYRDCLAAWHYWRQSPAEEAPVLCQSYAELLQELEEEIRQFLEQQKDSAISLQNGGEDGQSEEQK